MAPNLIHVRYPDFSPEQIRLLENTEVTQLKHALRRFLDEVRKTSECETVVVDCHGGPDQLSFAACLASDYCLLISEPDKITFYGTLHFLRQLRRVTPKDSDHNPDVRLVFNKVVSAFSAVYLRRFYDKEIRRLFDDRPLLAVFPMEMYLTKEFERTPFLTAVFPFSLLSKKTRVLLCDLLKGCHRQFVPKSIQGALRPRLALIRHSMGRTPWIADLNKVMAVIAIGGVLIFAVEQYGRSIEGQKNFYAMTSAVQNLETIQYAQKHPAVIPEECVGRQRWSERLSCWKSHSHQDAKGGPRISDFYGDEEIRKIWVGSSNNELQRQRAALLQNAELRSDQDPLIQDCYKKLAGSQTPSSLSLFILGFYELAQRFDEALSLAAVVWFLIALLSLWSAELDQIFTYSVRIRHRTRAFLTLLVSMALWFLPLLLLAVGIKECRGLILNKTNYVPSPRSTLLNEAIFILVAIALVVTAGVILQQWYKACQDFRYDKQHFEGFSRAAFGLYVFMMPLLSYKFFL